MPSFEPYANRKAEKPKFPSDIDWIKNEKLGELIHPDETAPRKTLLAPLGPYYDGGLKILAETPEFRLIQDHDPEGLIRVEWSYEIDRLCLKSTMRVNSESSSGADSWSDRVTLACALSGLCRFYDSNKQGLDSLQHPERQHFDEQLTSTPSGGLGCARQIGATLGSKISKALESEDVDLAIKDLVASFGVSLRAVARSRGLIEDKRTGNRPKAHHLIHAASSIFSITRERPSKQRIRNLLVNDLGFDVKGKNQSAFWSDLFNEAGLGDLPE